MVCPGVEFLGAWLGQNLEFKQLSLCLALEICGRGFLELEDKNKVRP